MKRSYWSSALVMASVLGGAALVYAGVPHTFANGDTLQAADLNGNFSALDQRIAALELPAGRALVSDGSKFNLSVYNGVSQTFELDTPANAVVTDVVLSMLGGSSALSITISDSGSKTYVNEAVGAVTSGAASGNLGIHLQSGITASSGLRIVLTCSAGGTGFCSGALMWSGYQP